MDLVTKGEWKVEQKRTETSCFWLNLLLFPAEGPIQELTAQFFSLWAAGSIAPVIWMVRFRGVVCAGDHVARLVNQPGASGDLEDAFSDWAQIFAEPAGRSLTLTCARSRLRSCISHPHTATAGSASDRGITEVPRAAKDTLKYYCSSLSLVKILIFNSQLVKSQMWHSWYSLA